MADIDKLSIEITASSAEASSEINRLALSLQRLQQNTKGGADGLEKTSTQIQKIAKAPSVAKLERELQKIEKQAIKDGDALLALQNKLDGLMVFKGVGNPLTVKGTDSMIRETEAEIQKLAASVDSLDAKARTLKQSIKSAGEVTQPIKDMGNNLKMAAQSCNSVSSAANKTADSLRSAAKGAENLGKSLEKSTKTGKTGLDKLIGTTKTLLTSWAIFGAIYALTSGISEGIKEAATENAAVNESLSKIVSSVHYVRDALVSAILPAIQAIQPLITFILDGLASVFNFVARVIGLLTGQTSVLQATKQQINFADSLDKTAESAKKALKALLPIDELTILDSNGGSSDSGSNRVHFTEIPTENNFNLPEFLATPLPSPKWQPDPVPAPEFAPVTLPSMAGVSIPSPAWDKNPVPAPVFEPLTVPAWATNPLPVPGWAENPIQAPEIATEPLISSTITIKQTLGEAWEYISTATEKAVEGISVKLGELENNLATASATIQQGFESFTVNTAQNVQGWRTSLEQNVKAVSEYIRTTITSALESAGASLYNFFSSTGANFAVWGANVGANVRTAIAYIPTAINAGLSAAGESIAAWVNGTSSNILAWGSNLIQNVGASIKGFYENFVSGLSAAWSAFKDFMKATGEKISSWWSANKSWAAPVAVAGLTTLVVGSIVLSGGGSLPAIGSFVKPALAVLPALAGGGVLTSPTTILAGEYPGARNNPEIVAPQKILRETFRQEQNNDDLINVIFSCTQQLIGAIRESGKDAPLNMNELTRQITAAQRRYDRIHGI